MREHSHIKVMLRFADAGWLSGRAPSGPAVTAVAVAPQQPPSPADVSTSDRPAAKRQRPSTAPRAASSLRPRHDDGPAVISPVAMFGPRGTGLPPRQLSSTGLASQLDQVLHMPQQRQQHEARAGLTSAAARTSPAASASPAPALSSAASPQAMQPGNAQSYASSLDMPAAAHPVHCISAPSQPQPSAFDVASRPDMGAAEVSPTSAPAQLAAQHSPAASPSSVAATTQAAVKQDGDAVNDRSPSSRPVGHSHAAPDDDPPQPSAHADAPEHDAHAADPLRLESLELKLSAAAAQRRPRTLRPRRPRTPEIADSAQLGAEQVFAHISRTSPRTSPYKSSCRYISVHQSRTSSLP